MDGGNMTGEGFYKADSGTLLYAQHAVYGPGFTLTRERPEETADGWQWFESAEEACAALGVEMPQPQGE